MRYLIRACEGAPTATDLKSSVSILRSFELEDSLYMCSRLLRINLRLPHDDKPERTRDVSHRHPAGTSSDTHAMTALRVLKQVGLHRSPTRSVRALLNVWWIRSERVLLPRVLILLLSGKCTGCQCCQAPDESRTNDTVSLCGKRGGRVVLTF